MHNNYPIVPPFLLLACHCYYNFIRLETIRNLEIHSSGVDDRFAFAHKIALDLFDEVDEGILLHLY